MRATGQGVRHKIVHTLPVDDLVLKSEEFSKNTLLPIGVQTLVHQVNQVALVRKDSELGVLQV